MTKFTVRDDGTIDGTFHETHFAYLERAVWDGDKLWLLIDHNAYDVGVRLSLDEAQRLAELITGPASKTSVAFAQAENAINVAIARAAKENP